MKSVEKAPKEEKKVKITSEEAKKKLAEDKQARIRATTVAVEKALRDNNCSFDVSITLKKGQVIL